MRVDKKDIEDIAKEFDYKFIDYQENIGMISYGKKTKRNGFVRINIYLTRATVGTCLNHPKKGKTQLFRRHCFLDDIKEIFKNPRMHTVSGYRKKKDGN